MILVAAKTLHIRLGKDDICPLVLDRVIVFTEYSSTVGRRYPDPTVESSADKRRILTVYYKYSFGLRTYIYGQMIT